MSVRFTPPRNERGAALLTVLLLVSVIAVIAATSLDRLLLGARLAGNASAVQQARAYMLSGEAIASSRIEDLLAADAGTLSEQGGWNGITRSYAVPGGTIRATLHDGNNCFNINGLVSQSEDGTLSANPVAAQQFNALLTMLDVPERERQWIVDGAIDWIDSDTVRRPGGAEDSDYRAMPSAYLPPNRLMAHVSELRAVRGVSAESWTRMDKWFCALPVAELSAINVNTLRPDQAPLLAMIAPEAISVDDARAYLAKRPISGYGSIARFWSGGPMANVQPSADVNAQPGISSQWFRLELQVNIGDAEVNETALIDASIRPARVIWRNWGER